MSDLGTLGTTTDFQRTDEIIPLMTIDGVVSWEVSELSK